MSSSTQTAATLDDLYREEGKAELIDGRIVPLIATGRRPSRVASRIFRSLDDCAQAIGRGEAYADNTGFAVAPLASGRESFSPDASYFLGPFPANEMRFLVGPPVFAVEVRSENITAMRPTWREPRRGLTTSRRAPSLCGTWTLSPIRSSSIVSMREIRRKSSFGARRPTPSPQFQIGRSLLM
jgi:hypothetical protein